MLISYQNAGIYKIMALRFDSISIGQHMLLYLISLLCSKEIVANFFMQPVFHPLVCASSHLVVVKHQHVSVWAGKKYGTANLTSGCEAALPTFFHHAAISKTLMFDRHINR